MKQKSKKIDLLKLKNEIEVNYLDRRIKELGGKKGKFRKRIKEKGSLTEKIF